MKLLTVRELAQQLDRPESTVRGWIKSGKLDAIRPGKRQILVDPRDVEEFKAKCKIVIETDPDVRAVLGSLFRHRRTA